MASRKIAGDALGTTGPGGSASFARPAPVQETNPVTPVDTFTGVENTSRPGLSGLLQTLQGSLDSVGDVMKQSAVRGLEKGQQDLQAEMQRQINSGATLEEIQANPAMAGQSEFLMRGAWESAGRQFAIRNQSDLQAALADPALADSQDPDEIATALGIIGDGGIPDGASDDFVRGYHEVLGQQIAKLINPHIAEGVKRKAQFQSHIRQGEAKSIGEQILGGEISDIDSINDMTAIVDEALIGGITLEQAHLELVEGMHSAVMDNLTNPIFDADDRADVYDNLATSMIELTPEGQAVDSGALSRIRTLQAQAQRAGATRLESRNLGVLREIETRYTARLTEETTRTEISPGPSSQEIYGEVVAQIGMVEAGKWRTQYEVGRGYMSISQAEVNDISDAIRSVEIQTPAQLRDYIIHTRGLDYLAIDTGVLDKFHATVAANYPRLNILSSSSARAAMTDLDKVERKLLYGLNLTDEQVTGLNDILSTVRRSEGKGDDLRPEGVARAGADRGSGYSGSSYELESAAVERAVDAGFDPKALEVVVAVQRARRVFRTEVFGGEPDIYTDPAKLEDHIRDASFKANETLKTLTEDLAPGSGDVLKQLNLEQDTSASMRLQGSDVLSPADRQRMTTLQLKSMTTSELERYYARIRRGEIDVTPEVEAAFNINATRGSIRPTVDFTHEQDFISRLMMRSISPDTVGSRNLLILDE